MFAVFEKFLANPKDNIRSMQGQKLDDTLDSYIPYELKEFDKNVLRWHVVLFVSEFLLDNHYTSAHFGEYRPGNPISRRPDKLKITEPTDFLNWSGQKLYERLKNHFNPENSR